MQALGEKRFDDAQQLLGQLRERDPLSAETRGLELELRFRSEQWSEAEALAQQLSRAFPSSARILYWCARVAYQQRDYGRAIDLFEQSTHIAPRHGSQRWLGKALTQAGQLDRAEAILQPLSESHPEAVTDLAWVHERKGQLREAVRLYRLRLEQVQDDAWVRQQLERLMAEEMSPTELVEEVELLAELEERPAEQLLPRYVECLLLIGRGDEARRYVRQELTDVTPRIRQALAWKVYQQQAYDLAFELFVPLLPQGLHNSRFMSALRKATDMTAREAELIEALEPLCEGHRPLHGTVRKLRKKLEERSESQP